MIGGGLSLALVPAPLVLAALVIYGLPSRARQPARAAGAIACALTLALLGLSAAQISGGGRIEVSYGAPVTGIDLLVRADPLGLLLSAAATAMVALTLLERSRPPLEVGALMVAVLGAVRSAPRSAWRPAGAGPAAAPWRP
jgi:formate hydrogenlyase subunit 3/multisubunit Na+/H+ antiporter MnhD subunit